MTLLLSCGGLLMADPVEVKQRKRHSSIAGFRKKVFSCNDNNRGKLRKAALGRQWPRDEQLFGYAWIECHSRYIVGARYYVRENLDILADSLHRVRGQHGASRELYVDNAKIYHAKALSLFEDAKKPLRSSRFTTMVEAGRTLQQPWRSRLATAAIKCGSVR